MIKLVTAWACWNVWTPLFGVTVSNDCKAVNEFLKAPFKELVNSSGVLLQLSSFSWNLAVSLINTVRNFLINSKLPIKASIIFAALSKKSIAVPRACSTHSNFSVITWIAPTGIKAAGRNFITAFITLITIFSTLSIVVIVFIIWLIVRSKAKTKVIVPSINLANLTITPTKAANWS